MSSATQTVPLTESTVINWDVPPSRPGLLRQWDEFVGPGYTRAETILLLAFAGIGALIIILYNLIMFRQWSVIQHLVIAVIAFDLLGGVVCNATSPAKRWYHRPGQGFRQHFSFIVFHAFHPALLALFFAPFTWLDFVLVYGFLLISAFVLLRVPLYLQRPTAFGLFALSMILGAFLVTPLAGFAWFLPIFYAKLLLAHLIREEPYRPARVV
jgi:hypothetical protein